MPRRLAATMHQFLVSTPLVALAALSAGAPAHAIDRYWIQPVIGQWTDSASWSSVPGGGGFAGVPLVGDSAWILTEFASDAPIVLFTGGSTPTLASVTLGGPGSPLLTMGGGSLNSQFVRVGRDGNGQLDVGGTAFLSASTELALGRFTDDEGHVDILSGGMVSASTVRIGIGGMGRVDQAGDGILDAGEVVLASNPFSSGIWTIDVAEDAAFVTADVEVGVDGDSVLDLVSGMLEVGGTIGFGTGDGSGTGTWSGGLVDAGAIDVRRTGAGALVIDGAEVTTGELALGMGGDAAVVTVSSGVVQTDAIVTGPTDTDLQVTGGVLATESAFIAEDASVTGTGRLRASSLLTIDATVFDRFLVDDAAQVLTPSLALVDGVLRLDGGTVAGAYLPPPFDTYILGDLESDGSIILNGGDLLMNVTSRGDFTFGAGITEFAIGGRLVVEDGFLSIREGITLSVGRDAALQGSFFQGSLFVDGTLDSLERITTVFGGQILGVGTILGGVNLGSRIVPEKQLEVGRIRFGGGLTMGGPDAAILVDIDDPGTGVHDVVQMLDASPVHLGGTLDFRVMKGWSPAHGDAVTAIEWPVGTPVTGDFDAIETIDVTVFPAGLDPVGEITATGYVLRFERRCAGDADLDGEVGFSDIVLVLASWGACAGCPADLDGDGVVDFEDLLVVLAGFGECG